MNNQNKPKKSSQEKNNNPAKTKPVPLRKTVDDPENDLFDDELFGADSDFEEGAIPKELPPNNPNQKEDNNPDNFEKPW